MTVGAAELIVARAPTAVTKGERAFVEASLPKDDWPTYSDLLGADDCSAIDREAYQRARTWYRSTDRLANSSEVQGVSLGRAYELRATAMLVAYLRARTVLARLTRPGDGTIIQTRDVGEEWTVAARSLGLSVSRRCRISRSLMSIVPDPQPSGLGGSDGSWRGCYAASRARLTLP